MRLGSFRPWIGFFAGPYPHGEPIFDGRKWAVPLRIIGAGWIGRVIEIDDEPVVLLAEIGMLDRIQQVTTTPVGLTTVRHVTEGQEESAPLAKNPEK